jgi:DNA adenine methylase
MTDEQHRELAAGLHELDGAVVLSGYPSELYSDLYSDWEFVKREAHGDGACDRTEVLWLNERAARGQSQMRLDEVPA